MNREFLQTVHISASEKLMELRGLTTGQILRIQSCALERTVQWRNYSLFQRDVGFFWFLERVAALRGRSLQWHAARSLPSWPIEITASLSRLADEIMRTWYTFSWSLVNQHTTTCRNIVHSCFLSVCSYLHLSRLWSFVNQHIAIYRSSVHTLLLGLWSHLHRSLLWSMVNRCITICRNIVQSYFFGLCCLPCVNLWRSLNQSRSNCRNTLHSYFLRFCSHSHINLLWSLLSQCINICRNTAHSYFPHNRSNPLVTLVTQNAISYFRLFVSNFRIYGAKMVHYCKNLCEMDRQLERDLAFWVSSAQSRSVLVAFSFTVYLICDCLTTVHFENSWLTDTFPALKPEEILSVAEFSQSAISFLR